MYANSASVRIIGPAPLAGAAPQPLRRQHPAEQRVRHQVAPPQPARLLLHPIKPLEAEPLPGFGARAAPCPSRRRRSRRRRGRRARPCRRSSAPGTSPSSARSWRRTGRRRAPRRWRPPPPLSASGLEVAVLRSPATTQARKIRRCARASTVVEHLAASRRGRTRASHAALPRVEDAHHQVDARARARAAARPAPCRPTPPPCRRRKSRRSSARRRAGRRRGRMFTTLAALTTPICRRLARRDRRRRPGRAPAPSSRPRRARRGCAAAARCRRREAAATSAEEGVLTRSAGGSAGTRRTPSRGGTAGPRGRWSPAGTACRARERAGPGAAPLATACSERDSLLGSRRATLRQMMSPAGVDQRAAVELGAAAQPLEPLADGRVVVPAGRILQVEERHRRHRVLVHGVDRVALEHLAGAMVVVPPPLPRRPLGVAHVVAARRGRREALRRRRWRGDGARVPASGRRGRRSTRHARASRRCRR